MKVRRETIEVKELSTGYVGKKGETVVAGDINASLYSGELTCLLGPNGAGKSTLLKTLSGFIPPLRGDIIIEGKALTRYSDAEMAKLISVVLTDRLSIDNMTVEELIGLGRSPYTSFWGRLTDHDRCIVEEAIKLVKIDNLRNRSVRTLSDGERQKVMIAKSLAQETRVIFLDEPTAFLDYPSKVEIMLLLQKLAREKGKTVFLSTHDLELALQIADKIWLIDKERGVTIGAPEDLSLNGDIERYFNREGASFDATSGQFKINFGERAKAVLRGDGPRRELARRALVRNGIFPLSPHENYAGDVSENQPEMLIEIKDGGYIVNGKPVSTIAGLIEAVESLT